MEMIINLGNFGNNSSTALTKPS